MLQRVTDVAAAPDALEPAAPANFAFRNFCQRSGVLLLADSLERPSALVALRGADFMLHALTPAARTAALRDLFAGRIAEAAGWPDDAARRDWEREGRAYLFVNTSPLEVWEGGLSVGFEVPPDFDSKHPPANLYWFEGAPRLSSEIRHSCRLGRGMELWDRLRSGVGYDSEGEYVSAILREQPSFVCEVQGEPVCWSTVHLNGTMGMIYTPPEHRRQGYARSLTSFQIDHVLRRHGFACCHVVGDNVASYTLLLDLGARREATQVVWRILYWPAGECPFLPFSRERLT